MSESGRAPISTVSGEKSEGRSYFHKQYEHAEQSDRLFQKLHIQGDGEEPAAIRGVQRSKEEKVSKVGHRGRENKEEKMPRGSQRGLK